MPKAASQDLKGVYGSIVGIEIYFNTHTHTHAHTYLYMLTQSHSYRSLALS